MKKIIYASAIFASMMMASCGGSSSNDLEQAQTFAVDVAKKISMNQKDSVVALYPDAEKADSFVTSFVADSVKVLPTDSATIFTAIGRIDSIREDLKNGLEDHIKNNMKSDPADEVALSILRRTSLNVYKNMSKEERKKIRKIIRSL